MATVNFSVPDNVKRDFDRAFQGENKSAVIADLMRGAIEQTKLRKRRMRLFRTLTARRQQRPPATDAQIRAARAKTRR
ncbi:MAG: hypothetical protein ACT4O5_00335 [Gammaproteobacteria bacterium]